MTSREREGWNYIMNETLRASRVVMIISVQSVISVNLPRLRHSFFLLRARDLDFDEAVGPGLRRIDLGVLAGVLDALVPAQVCVSGRWHGQRMWNFLHTTGKTYHAQSSAC